MKTKCKNYLDSLFLGYSQRLTFSALRDLISLFIKFNEIQRGSHVIGNTITEMNDMGLALRNSSVKTASTPRIANAMRQLFNVVLLLVSSFRFSSDSFFMTKKYF